MNKKYLNNFSLGSVGLILCLTSCANHQSPNTFEETLGKTLVPPQGKALICVYRPSKPFSGLIPRPVFINRQHVASTSSGSFVVVPVKPGSYTVQAAAQALLDDPAQRAAYPDIKVGLKAGESIFIKQTINSSASNSQSSVMMLQTGAGPIPVTIGGGLLPTGAELVSSGTGRSVCAGLKQVGAEFAD